MYICMFACFVFVCTDVCLMHVCLHTQIYEKFWCVCVCKCVRFLSFSFIFIQIIFHGVHESLFSYFALLFIFFSFFFFFSIFFFISFFFFMLLLIFLCFNLSLKFTHKKILNLTFWVFAADKCFLFVHFVNFFYKFSHIHM